MILAIDLGGMSAKAALLTKDGKLLGKAQVATSAKEGAEQTVAALHSLMLACAENAAVPLDEIEAVGVGAPGIIDSETGTVVAWTTFGWENFPLAEKLGARCQKKVFVLNDANAVALGEAKFGAGKYFESSILVTLGTGIGGGIVIGGELFEGYMSAGGEIGHTVIRHGGRKCSCGRRGCFEMYASTRALVRDAERMRKKYPESTLNCAKKIDGKVFFAALKERDVAAKEVFSNYIEVLGEGILNLVNLFRPQAVLVGGGISAQGETLLNPLREYVSERLLLPEYAPLEILAAELRNDAGLYGTAEYARRRYAIWSAVESVCQKIASKRK